MAAFMVGVTASPAAAQTSAPDTVPVVLTVSGAISLGAYQGGVHWGLTEFLRKTHDDREFRRAMTLASGRAAAEEEISTYTIAAAAGASAGNINGILTAIEWCRAPGTLKEPEQSIFWLSWIRTGWEQLFPVSDLGDWETNLAIFTRRYLDAELEQTIRDSLAQGEKRPGCRVPVGITITRLQPDMVPVDSLGLVSAASQRFASVLDVATEAGRLTFRQPSDTTVWRDRSLGRVVRLPGEGGTEVLPVRSVIRLVEASSAFPVAFAPVQLTYEDPAGCRRDRSKCGSQTYAFSDGGAFDNNPLDLAYGLYRHHLGSRGTPPHPDTRVVYVDVDKLRGQLERTRAVQPDPAASDRGIGAVLALLGGAVPSARQYELQTLARAFARDTLNGEKQASWIRVTDRFYPVVGEHLGYFAAFLGRPFREYDFYVGIYDGLHFAAQDLVCRGDPNADGCTERVLADLLEGDYLQYGRVAPLVLDSLYRLEYGRGLRRPAPVLVTPEDSARALFAATLVTANRPLLRPFFNEACAPRQFTERLSCRDGFGLMLDGFSTFSVTQTARRFGSARHCAPSRWLSAPDAGCIADQSFRDLVIDRDAFFVRLVDLLLHQTWRVEDRLNKDRAAGTYGALAHESVAEALELAYRSALPTDEGLVWFPSTIPGVVRHRSKRLRYLPYHVGTNLEAGGIELGYRPTWHLSRGFAAVFPVGWNWRPPSRHALGRTPATSLTPGQSYVHGGASLLWKTNRLLFSGVELGPEILVNTAPRRQWTTTAGASAGVYLVANKIRIGTRFIIKPSPAFHRGNSWGFTLGISDFNGLVYWIARTID